MDIKKKIIFTICFVLAVLVLPIIILLLFVDSSNSFGAYVIVFGIIIFAVFGYMLSCIISLEKNMKTTIEEIKMQNAAIAYKITSGNAQPLSAPAEAQVKAEEKSAPVTDTSNVPLNPAEPLVMPEKQKAPAREEKKIVDDGYNDFR